MGSGITEVIVFIGAGDSASLSCPLLVGFASGAFAVGRGPLGGLSGVDAFDDD